MNQSSTQNILIIGGDGTIGRGLATRFAEMDGVVCWQTTRRARSTADDHRIALDLTEPPANWPELPAVDVAYLCAGVTLQSACQRDPVSTRLINVDRTLVLAERLISRNTLVVMISTNLVFDGTQPLTAADHPVAPVTEYGRQKAIVEQALLTTKHQAVVVRLGKVLPPNYSLFQTWRTQLLAGETICPFRDLSIAPLPLEFVVDLLWQVGRRRCAGIIQATGTPDVTYAEIGARIASRLDVTVDLVRPQEAGHSRPDLLPIPQHTTLAPSSELDAWGLTIPPVWTTIDAAC